MRRELLESKIDRSGGPGACHPWRGRRDEDGYARFGKGCRRVSRIVLEGKLGRPLRPGMMALHTCDNPPCCNAEHLYEGTHAQNMADRSARGRTPVNRVCGSRNGRSKLSEEAVRAIRDACKTTPRRKVARAFGVSHVTVLRIEAGQLHASP